VRRSTASTASTAITAISTAAVYDCGTRNEDVHTIHANVKPIVTEIGRLRRGDEERGWRAMAAPKVGQGIELRGEAAATGASTAGKETPSLLTKAPMGRRRRWWHWRRPWTGREGEGSTRVVAANKGQNGSGGLRCRGWEVPGHKGRQALWRRQADRTGKGRVQRMRIHITVPCRYHCHLRIAPSVEPMTTRQVHPRGRMPTDPRVDGEVATAGTAR